MIIASNAAIARLLNQMNGEIDAVLRVKLSTPEEKLELLRRIEKQRRSHGNMDIYVMNELLMMKLAGVAIANSETPIADVPAVKVA